MGSCVSLGKETNLILRGDSIFVTHFWSTPVCPVCPYFPKLSLLLALPRSISSGFVLHYSACHLWGQALTAARLVGVSWMWITGTELVAKDCPSHPAGFGSDWRAGAESPLLPRGMSARHGTLHPLSLGIWLPVLGRCCSPSLQKEKQGLIFESSWSKTLLEIYFYSKMFPYRT